MRQFMWRYLQFFAIFLTLSITMLSYAQENVIIQTQVTGNLLVVEGNTSNRRLISIDTQMGSTTMVAENVTVNLNPTWDTLGQRIVYRSPVPSLNYVNYPSLNITNVSLDQYGYDSWQPMGWSSDGSDILYLAATVGFPSTQISFYSVNVDTATPTLVWEFNTRELLPEFAPFQELSNYIIADVYYVERNPVYDQWSVIQFRVEEPEDTPPELTLLWNLQNNTFIPVIDPTQGQDIIAFPPVWHDNGDELVLISMDNMRQLYITVWEFSPDGTLTLKETTPTERQILFSLGAGDLLIARNIDNPSIYYLGEIINGQWFETAFIEFPESYGNISPGDWYIIATESERAQLSCLFDQTLPQRLNVGNLGQVAFTDGTASRLRDEPSVDGVELTLMPEGTQFDVIGGAYCADEYRWLQLQLDDGTIGWAVEATAQAYWLEPIE